MRNGKLILSIAIFATFFLGNAYAEDFTGVTFLSTLRQGDSNPAVLTLQKILNNDPDTRIANEGVGSPGQETNYFGGLTKNAVIRFQEKYKNEILIPAGLSRGTGFVGLMTIKKLNEFSNIKTSVGQNQIKTVSPSVYQSPSNAPVSQNQPQNSLAPIVLSVSPNRVRRGDVVTIKGKNFTPVNNIVILGDGPVRERFDGLASFDGETLTFIYEPPVITTMTKAEILALPSDILKQIEDPISKAGITIDDVITPYKGINSEVELSNALLKTGHSIDGEYHYFHILVFNNQGNTMSTTALLYGLRDFPFDNVANKFEKSFISKVGSNLVDLVSIFTSTADAVGLSGGGFTSGTIFPCTCSGAVMTFQMSYTGSGTGMYVFNIGFLPNAGSGRAAGPWLGGFIPGAGICPILIPSIPPFCIYIPGNLPSLPVGYAF